MRPVQVIPIKSILPLTVDFQLLSQVLSAALQQPVLYVVEMSLLMVALLSQPKGYVGVPHSIRPYPMLIQMREAALDLSMAQ